MKHIDFENHREEKIPSVIRISVLTPVNTVESGWTNGRSFEEIEEDFGMLNKDWFYFEWQAKGYLIKNRLREIVED